MTLSHYFSSPSDYSHHPASPLPSSISHPSCSFTLTVNLQSSSLPWHLVSPCPDADLSDPADAECVSVPFLVDRRPLLFYLPTALLLDPQSDYLARAVAAVCEQENLSAGNCELVGSTFVDAVKQQRGGDVSAGSRLRIDIVGTDIDDERSVSSSSSSAAPFFDSPFPYPSTFSIPCTSVPPGHYTIQISVSNYSGYSSGKSRLEDTAFAVGLKTSGGECEAAEKFIEDWLEEPRSGGVYRRDVPVRWSGGGGTMWGDGALADLVACVDGKKEDECTPLPADRGETGTEAATSAATLSLEAGRRRIVFRKKGERTVCGGVVKVIEVIDNKFTVLASPPASLATEFAFNYLSHSVEGLNSRLNSSELLDKFAAGVPGVKRVEVAVTNVSTDVEVATAGLGEGRKEAMTITILERDVSRLFGGKDLAFVTACDANYFDDGRLPNLIGSIQHWEPAAEIILYGMGEGEAAERMER